MRRHTDTTKETNNKKKFVLSGQNGQDEYFWLKNRKA